MKHGASMKISEVIVRRYNAGVAVPDLSVGRETLVVEIHTDSGARGLGFLYANIAAHGTAGDLYATYIRRNLRSLLLGKDPLHTEALWRTMYQSTWRQVRGRFGMMCLSAVDLALWDLKGKIAGVPVCDLLGGRRDRIPTYCTAGFHMAPDKLAQSALKLVKHGHRALKLRASFPATSLDDAVARVRAVREAVGPGVKIMVDVNGTWTTDIAIQQLKRWEPYDVYWLEEPVPVDDIPGYVKVRSKAGSTRIAGGENHTGVAEFRQLIDAGAVDIAQPSHLATGGLTDWLKVNAYAAARGVPVSPWQFPEVNTHTAAAFPNVMWIEYVAPRSELEGHALFKSPAFEEEITADGVFLKTPLLPGFGFELDEAVAERILIREA
jgi:L-alanine-DL-glutamate epimerase-like enolase superfamily enzyme